MSASNLLTRRSLLRALPALLAAPAIVRVASIMPVKAWSIARPGVVVLDSPSYWALAWNLNQIFKQSVAEPALKGFLANIANFEIYLEGPDTGRGVALNPPTFAGLAALGASNTPRLSPV